MALRPKKPSPDTSVSLSAAEVDDRVAPGMRVAAAWSWRILVVAALIALVGLLVALLRDVTVPVFVAILLAALLVPLKNWLVAHRWPRGLAVAVCEVGLLVVIAGLITVVVIFVRRGFPELQSQTVTKYDDFVTWLSGPPFSLSHADIDAYVQQGLDALNASSSTLLSGALTVGTSLLHVLAGALIALFTTLFILIDGRGMFSWVARLFPARSRAAVVGAAEAGWVTLKAFVQVQLLVAFIDAVGIGLGAFILGLFYGGFPLVIPIAIAVFLASFIPVVGAVVTGVFAVFVALVYLGPIPAIIMLGIVILVQQLEGHVLQPLIIGTAIKVHPVAVVLGVATGGFIGGIPGALFAVPFIAVLNVMIGYIARGEWRTHPHPSVADLIPPTKARASRVR
ncbi:MAG TPA: AI-2E family transporter [Pseudolysinimonas sp.]|jgi:predicted PurR-regulated permease PerM|nr:AI-2E family transporter [Pseudolysinimonas sp.]